MLNREANNRLAKQKNPAQGASQTSNLFRDFVEQVSVGISVTAEDGRIILWNTAMELITGRLGDITLGNFIWEVYFDLLSLEMKKNNTRDQVQAKFLSYLTSGIPDTQKSIKYLDIVRQDSNQFVKENVFAIPTAKGYCLFSVLHDESMHLLAENVLKTDEDNFGAVVEQAEDGIIVLDAQEEILEWNGNSELISRVERKRAIGMHLSDALPEFSQRLESGLVTSKTPLHQRTLSYLNSIADSYSSHVNEWVIKQRHGKYKWYQSVIFPIRVSETLLFGIIIRDVTLTKQAEHRLKRYNRQLETLRLAGLEISAELGLDTLIWKIASRGMELLNGTAIALYLHNPEKDILELAISLGDNQPKLEEYAQRGVGLAGQIWETGNHVLLEDFHTGQTQSLAKSYWGKVAGVPIIWGQEFMGVIFVFSDQKFFESDLKILGLFSSHAATSIRNARLHRQVSQLAITDSLTGIYNRRHFFEMAEKEFHQAVRYNDLLSVIMFDLDLFKKLNDEYGHIQGDEILKKVVLRCAEQMRDADIFGRYGGEEFVAALPQTNAKDAFALAERLRKSLYLNPIELQSMKVNVTASFGVSTLMPDDIDLLLILNRADEALYFAKQTGRNKVIMWKSDFH